MIELGRSHNLEKQKKEKEKLLVVYAGTSARRRSFFSYCLPQCQIEHYFAGEEVEDDTDCTVPVMKGKIDYVSKQIGKREGVIIAADVRTHVLGLADQGHTVEKSYGKPDNPEEVRELLKEMIEASVLEDCVPYYQVISSSGIMDVKTGSRKIFPHRTTTVILDFDKLRALAKPKGFQGYKRTVRNFYSREPYSNGGELPPVSILDISGGLSLLALTRLNLVTEIDDVRRDDPNFFNALKKAVYNVGVGVAPQALREIVPNIDRAIDEWPWLNRVATDALSANKSKLNFL